CLPEERLRLLVRIRALPPAQLGLSKESERVVMTSGGLGCERLPWRPDQERRSLFALCQSQQALEQIGTTQRGRLAREIGQVEVPPGDAVLLHPSLDGLLECPFRVFEPPGCSVRGDQRNVERLLHRLVRGAAGKGDLLVWCFPTAEHEGHRRRHMSCYPPISPPPGDAHDLPPVREQLAPSSDAED